MKAAFSRRKHHHHQGSVDLESSNGLAPTMSTQSTVTTASTMTQSQRWKRLRRPLSIISTASSPASPSPSPSTSSPSPQQHWDVPSLSSTSKRSSISSTMHSRSHSGSVSSTLSSDFTTAPYIPPRSDSRNFVPGHRRSQPSIYGKGSINDLSMYVKVRDEDEEGGLFDVDDWISTRWKDEGFSSITESEEPESEKESEAYTSLNLFNDYLKTPAQSVDVESEIGSVYTAAETATPTLTDSSSAPTTPSASSFNHKYTPTRSPSGGVVWVGDNIYDNTDEDSPIPQLAGLEQLKRRDQSTNSICLALQDDDDEEQCPVARTEWA